MATRALPPATIVQVSARPMHTTPKMPVAIAAAPHITLHPGFRVTCIIIVSNRSPSAAARIRIMPIYSAHWLEEKTTTLARDLFSADGAVQDAARRYILANFKAV